jgi:hypothetical protein
MAATVPIDDGLNEPPELHRSVWLALIAAATPTLYTRSWIPWLRLVLLVAILWIVVQLVR